MKAVRWQGVQQVRVEEVADPSVQEPEDAVLRVTTAAICGSDLHLYNGKVPKVSPGMVIGHEFVGVVEEIGSAVRSFSVGARCVAAMFVACGRCLTCTSGAYMRCPRYAMFGMGDLFGGLVGGQAERVRVPIADMALAAIPDGLDDVDALFVGDILSTAYSACLRAAIRPGEIVVVVGAGPVGQLIVSCAQLFSPSAVYAVDLVPARLEAARALGAIPLDPAEGDVIAQLRDRHAGRRADVVLEAVGSAGSLETAWRAADTGGRIVLVGMLFGENFPESAGRTWMRNLSVLSVVGDPYTHREALLRLVGAGRLRPSSVVSESVPLDAAADAYARLAARQTAKVVLRP